jgi:hypothetical protein
MKKEKILYGIIIFVSSLFIGCSSESDVEKRLKNHWKSTQNGDEKISFGKEHWEYTETDNFTHKGDKYRIINNDTYLEMWNSAEGGSDRGFQIEIIKISDQELVLNFGSERGIKSFERSAYDISKE